MASVRTDSSWRDKLPWESVGPLIFLVLAGAACFVLLPPDQRKEAAYLVIGAAITRVKVSRPSN